MAGTAGCADAPCRNYISRSWPNPGTLGEQVHSMYDRLTEASLKEARAAGDGGKSTGPVDGKTAGPKEGSGEVARPGLDG
jgi:hypothetical protein